MNEELQTLHDNYILDIVHGLDRVKVIGCKWVYTKKLYADGSIEQHKIRLVALGNRYEYSLYHVRTFALVTKITIVRTIIAIAAS